MHSEELGQLVIDKQVVSKYEWIIGTLNWLLMLKNW